MALVLAVAHCPSGFVAAVHYFQSFPVKTWGMGRICVESFVHSCRTATVVYLELAAVGCLAAGCCSLATEVSGTDPGYAFDLARLVLHTVSVLPSALSFAIFSSPLAQLSCW